MHWREASSWDGPTTESISVVAASRSQIFTPEKGYPDG
jgi:hypothetical protein